MALIRAARFEILPECRFVIDDGGDQCEIGLNDPCPDDPLIRTSDVMARKPV